MRQAASQTTNSAMRRDPGRKADGERGLHCRALTMCSRSSCTMPVNSRRERHFEIARARDIDHALGQHAARPRRHHEDAVGEEHGLAQVVRHQHDGDLARRVQVADHAPQLLAREGIERAERLVEHQQFGLVDQRAAERGALLHAAGELPRDTCRPGRAGPTEASSASARATYSALWRRMRLRCGSTISSGSRRFSSVVRQGSSVGAWNAMPAIFTGWDTT